MSRLQAVLSQQMTMSTIMTLTSAFEGIASMRIAQTKNQVLRSQRFFSELWNIYTQLRVDELFRFGRTDKDKVTDKQLYILITSGGAFSGDIDQRLIDTMKRTYDPAKQDIIVVGRHGATQLSEQGIAYKKYYALPLHDKNINVTPLIVEASRYRDTMVFYQTYVSLMVQEIRSVSLVNAVKEQGKGEKARDDLISEENYIFEPSSFDVVAHLESSMMQIALSQFILDSKLAQYASRFRAMSVAKDRASDLHGHLKLLYSRTKRSLQDERTKEVISGLQKAEAFQ